MDSESLQGTLIHGSPILVKGLNGLYIINTHLGPDSYITKMISSTQPNGQCYRGPQGRVELEVKPT